MRIQKLHGKWNLFSCKIFQIHAPFMYIMKTQVCTDFFKMLY